jgi:DNA mismatch endonuclease (patch repair protein)
VRKIAHHLGYRFRLHVRDLPGSPDLVFPKYRKVIFVHGCYWHRHEGCRLAYIPKSNVDFWRRKFDRNLERDAASLKQLAELGWIPLVIWECEVDNSAKIAARIRRHLGPK